MARQVTGMDDDGRVVSHQLTRAQRKSERLIPWTAGPQTKWEKFKRKAVG